MSEVTYRLSRRTVAMSGQQQRLPPPDFSAEPQQSSRAFQAARDWSWSQPEPGVWSSRGGHRAAQPRAAHHNSHHHHHHHEGWRGSMQQHWGKKKQPEFSHFCDSCDRGFKTQDKYEEHIAQHVKCSVPDCQFSAHEKLVKIHWRNNHTAGAKRIKLETEEDIRRWREERRRNYPTLRNVEKKQKLMEVKEQRGDVLETPQFGRFRGRGGPQRGRGSSLGKRQHEDRDPLAALADSEADSDKDECVQKITVAPRSVTAALGSLMSSYGEQSSEEDDAPLLKAAQVLQENQNILTTPQHTHTAPTATQHTHTSPTATQHTAPQSHHAQRHRGRGRRGGRGGRGAHNKPAEPQRQPPTLLEMLLAPDIRHERNVVLQCVRFIIRNRFFGLAGKDVNEISVCEEPISQSQHRCSES
ncbi:FMR1-interacting protein NUFIP1 isoform X1 [Danio rerio]|uniref:FMR1-interacting protein NUFIP1 isoform X1 n=2 Tax=Danio rerio TaxID=7955 RepID=A0AC58JQF6_DANRE